MHGATSIAYDVTVALTCTTFIALAACLVLCIKKKSIKPKNFPSSIRHSAATAWQLTAIHAATEGFSHQCMLGTGHLGTVYKAVFPDAKVVAVKRVNPHLVLINTGSDFATRMKALSLAHHPRVTPILGYCEAPGERIIVMEMMPMNSLEFHLHNINHKHCHRVLDWPRRVRIAAESARGIEYLHEGAFPHIVHGCLTSSNILLDSSFSASVSDYGLCFLSCGGGGYLDSECSLEEGLCKASDVYSFGVVLLEILSGRRWEGGSIVEWALPLIRESRAIDILDPRLEVPLDTRPLIRLAKVASACVGNSRKNRPSIVQVAAILNSLEMQ